MQIAPSADVLANADRCVLCGLCTPRCPTYIKTRDEAESPRGRVALISAAFNHALPITPRLKAHVDSCLSCRACEAACPAGVNVTDLVDEARAAMAAGQKRSASERLTDRILGSARWLHWSAKVLRLVEKSRVRRIARHAGLLKLLRLDAADARLPAIPSQPVLRHFYAARGTQRAEVALFRGCATGLFDTQTLLDAIHVLNRLGIGVHVPAAQACCGALHQHSGATSTAAALAQQNVTAFAAVNTNTIVGVATGCVSMLVDYRKSNDAPAVAFAGKIMDINAYLAQLDWPADVTLAPMRARIAVHLPCSQRFGLRDNTSTFTLLKKIPEADIVALPGNDVCCGAAGAHMLTQTAMADALLIDKLDSLDGVGADVLVTSNIGCALHFRQGLQRSGKPLDVVHPVTLLRRQLVSSQDSR